jgi:Raf kinase inhibitor-like YbhB/YbcL family protein
MQNRSDDRPVDFKTLRISCAAFQDGGLIPKRYTCDGENISPPLDIEGIPVQAKCLAIIVKDPDAPAGTWVHWLIWNIPVTHHLKEKNVHGVEGVNSFQMNGYGGPCPPAGKPHRYFFKIYALDDLLPLPAGTQCHAMEKSLSKYILAYGEMMGIYQRQKS